MRFVRRFSRRSKRSRSTSRTRTKAPVASCTKTSAAPLIAQSRRVTDRKPSTDAGGPLSPVSGASQSGVPVATGTRDTVAGADVDPSGQPNHRS